MNKLKWSEYAGELWDLFTYAASLREDLIIFLEAHIEPYDADGETYWRFKAQGQKVTRLNMFGKVNYNLYSHVEYSPTGNKYSLLTTNNGKNECRSVEGVLDVVIPNDFNLIANNIREKA